MNADDFVPANQIRGWLFKLCEQNATKLASICQITRVSLQRKMPAELRGPLDRSETNRDRANAANFYHRAFWRFATVQQQSGRAEIFLWAYDTGIVRSEDWVFEPRPQRGDDWTGFTCDHVYKHLCEEKLIVTAPKDPMEEGRGIQRIDQQRREHYLQHTRLVGAHWAWPKSQLPTRAVFASYAKLPADFEQDPPILGLPKGDPVPPIPEGKAILESAKHLVFEGLKQEIATFFAFHMPTGKPAKVSWAKMARRFFETTNVDIEVRNLETKLSRAWGEIHAS
jgi:hypothetical protein